MAAIVASLHGLKGMTTIARGLSEKLDGLSSSSDWSCSLDSFGWLYGYTDHFKTDPFKSSWRNQLDISEGEKTTMSTWVLFHTWGSINGGNPIAGWFMENAVNNFLTRMIWGSPP